MTRDIARRLGEESILVTFGPTVTKPLKQLKSCPQGHRYREGTKAAGGCPECRRTRNTIEAARYRRRRKLEREATRAR